MVHKKLRPASGDAHDYSLGTYWWPNPRRPNGLPIFAATGILIRSENNDTDTSRIIRMCERCDLGLAWYFTVSASTRRRRLRRSAAGSLMRKRG